METRDHFGVVRRIAGFTHKRATEELERQITDLVAARAVGQPLDRHQRYWVEGLLPSIRDRLCAIGLLQPADVAGLRPIRAALPAWRAALGTKKTKPRRVEELCRYVTVVLDSASLNLWTEIRSENIRKALANLQESRTWTDRTAQRHAQAVRQLCRWAVTERLISEDPLRTLGTVGTGVQSGHERRALTLDELVELLATTAHGPPIAGMSGRERAVVYRLAVETGLRRGEIVKLTAGDFDVDRVDEALLRAPWTATKNDQVAHIPLRPLLASLMKTQLAAKLPSAPAFSMHRSWRAAESLRADLARAGVPHLDAMGRVVDFHALRVTFSTNLARANVPIQIAQKLMRHSTPVLTSNVYTLLNKDDERRALARLPQIPAPAERREVVG